MQEAARARIPGLCCPVATSVPGCHQPTSGPPTAVGLALVFHARRWRSTMRGHIVVGAGTAGAIIAARLSEQPNTNVLLLEAGPDYEGEGSTPADLLDSKNIAGPAHDWGYKAIPVQGRVMPYQRGKVGGRTSAINAAAALWARPADFDAWVRLGNTE